MLLDVKSNTSKEVVLYNVVDLRWGDSGKESEKERDIWIGSQRERDLMRHTFLSPGLWSDFNEQTQPPDSTKNTIRKPLHV